MLTVVLVILGEALAGTHATPHFAVILLANLPWLAFTAYIISRLQRHPTPPTREMA